MSIREVIEYQSSDSISMKKAEMTRALRAAFIITKNELIAYVRALGKIPVKSGTLKSSFYIEDIIMDSIESMNLGFSSTYAIFHDLGTKFIVAKHFMTDILDHAGVRLEINIRNEIQLVD